MAEEKREMLGQEMCVHSKLTLGCAGCFVHLKRKAARLQQSEAEHDTLLAGLKAEVETRRAEVKAIDESAETLTGEEICEMQMHAEIADRLEHLIKQAGGEV